jgi:transposase-like protein
MLYRKERFIMNMFSLMECCSLLGIDPKTMRRWLIQAGISTQNDPQDARRKCITGEELQHLAVLHHRLLHERKEVSALKPEMDLMKQQCTSLEAQLTELHAQLHQLTQEMQAFKQEKEIQEKNISSHPQEDVSCIEENPQHELAVQGEVKKPQKRTQVIPLVEYGAQGTYTIISPEAGRLPFFPDSPEWFAWLEEIPSFRFEGQFGHFTATCVHRTALKSRWRADRHIRGRGRNQRLGQTLSLTLATLEQAAAVLQSYMN